MCRHSTADQPGKGCAAPLGLKSRGFLGYACGIPLRWRPKAPSEPNMRFDPHVLRDFSLHRWSSYGRAFPSQPATPGFQGAASADLPRPGGYAESKADRKTPAVTDRRLDLNRCFVRSTVETDGE